jgi:hypothetical protein
MLDSSALPSTNDPSYSIETNRLFAMDLDLSHHDYHHRGTVSNVPATQIDSGGELPYAGLGRRPPNARNSKKPRELETDQSEEHFDATVKRIAKSPQPKDARQPAKKQ